MTSKTEPGGKEGRWEIVERIQVWGDKDLSWGAKISKVEILVTAIQQPFMEHLLGIKHIVTIIYGMETEAQRSVTLPEVT